MRKVSMTLYCCLFYRLQEHQTWILMMSSIQTTLTVSGTDLNMSSRNKRWPHSRKSSGTRVQASLVWTFNRRINSLLYQDGFHWMSFENCGSIQFVTLFGWSITQLKAHCSVKLESTKPLLPLTWSCNK